ncbi:MULTISPECIES: HD domain-containing phosphohydrolase [unclassified Vibrio]|uniref:HD domain-containing phosphohydrolase n=1 Tax=unclassified Vibrio TaxID=2614977 RepID=UPI002556FA5B|nr:MULTISPECIES: HD domain-containing phosphohydrolase [unclassified Vibrio]
MQKKTHRRVSLRVVLGLMFVFCAFVTGGVAITLQYYFASQTELKHTLARYQTIASGVSDYFSNLQNVAENVTRSGVQLVDLIGMDSSTESIALPLSKLLLRDPSLHSIFVAQGNNDFFQIIHLESGEIRAAVGAKGSEKWLVVVHQGEGNQRRKTSTFYDQSFTPREVEQEYSNYLPTQRSWYKNATTGTVYNTSPYLFNTLKLTGETFATRVEGSDTVVGVDVLLSSLEARLTNRFVENKKQPQAEAFVYRSDGRLVASNQRLEINEKLPLVSPIALTAEQQQLVDSTPELKVSNQHDWAPLDYTIVGRPHGFAIDLFKVISDMTGLKFKFVNDGSWGDLVADFNSGKIDVLQSLSDPTNFSQTSVVGDPLYRGNFALLMNSDNEQIKTFEDVTAKRVGILRGWSMQDNIQDAYPELKVTSYASLHTAIDDLERGKIDAVLDLTQVLMAKVREKFRENLKIVPVASPILSREIYFAVSDEYRDVADIINLALASLSEEHRQELRDKWFSPDSLPSTHTFLPYPELIKLTGTLAKKGSVELVTINGVEKYLYISELTYKAERYFAVLVPKAYIMAGVNESTWYSVGGSLFVLAVLIPFAWAMAAPIANPINLLRQQVRLVRDRQYDKVQRVHSRIEEIHQLGLSVTRGSNSLKHFEEQQNLFFESMIQLIARAIDEKSPYTAGHCNRVPEIALMLAEAAEQSDQGAFKDFHFKNDEERREFRIAAWLHDCGKIATPEYVVDKGSKLETNYNRIHEVRMRYEVLWRDAQIKYLLSRLGEEVELDNVLRPQLDSLQEQFAFVANANVGKEFMSDEDVERIEKLAEIEWTRYFDSSLGLSPLEETRVQPKSTPAVEKLLTDREEHIIERDQPFVNLEEFGINMRVPEKLYNHGELYNLSIRRGTLTNEERFKINEHMISGIKMLESIPFPPELERVPRYATTHHETLMGTGYPRGLGDSDLSVPERILVVADIFEALTASDRPYKKAKPLSEAISILSKMMESGHIDKDVFQLLLTSGVYHRYAEQHLAPELLDIEDIKQFLD